MVRVMGFEPMVSRSRTVRDTKLRHTLMRMILYVPRM